MSITNKQNNNTGRDSGAKDTKIETVSEEVKYAKKFVILKGGNSSYWPQLYPRK